MPTTEEISAVAPKPPTQSVTLWDLETNLQALLDTEALVSVEQEEEFRRELAASFRATTDKRERVGQFLAYCEAMQEAADKEMARLQQRKALFVKAQARTEEYLVWIIEQMGQDAKGKWPKLQGHTVSFTIQQNPSSVEIEDVDQVPDEYRTVTLMLPASVWRAHLERYTDLRKLVADEDFECEPPFDQPRVMREARISYTAPKAPIKKAIEAGVDVPGADLKPGAMRLVVK